MILFNNCYKIEIHFFYCDGSKLSELAIWLFLPLFFPHNLNNSQVKYFLPGQTGHLPKAARIRKH
jgi:hypothetical protein